MTCLLATVHEGKIYMAGDSCVANSYRRQIMSDSKVLRFDNMLIGFAGWPRDMQIVMTEYSPAGHPEGMDDLRYVIKYIAEPIRQLTRDFEHAQIQENKATMESQLLVGYHQRVYTIETNFQITTNDENFGVVGSGTYYALGAFAALSESQGLTLEGRLLKTLEIVARYDPYVCAPFYIETL